MQDFVMKNLIYHVVGGSVAYGLNTKDSDVDKRGITIPPLEYFFGLKIFNQEELTVDETIFALHKFVRLAFDCNPNIIEILYTDPKNILFMNKYGEMLRDSRHLFLSRRARYTFGGYAYAQLKRIKGHRKWIMFDQKKPREEDFLVNKVRKSDEGTIIKYQKFQEQEFKNALKKYNQYLDWKKNRNPERAKLEEKYGYDTKHAMHLIRLLRMGKEILETGEVNVLRPDREDLLDVRNGKWTYKKLISTAEAYEKDLDRLYETSKLPKKPDHKAINALLIKITEEFFKNN